MKNELIKLEQLFYKMEDYINESGFNADGYIYDYRLYRYSNKCYIRNIKYPNIKMEITEKRYKEINNLELIIYKLLKNINDYYDSCLDDDFNISLQINELKKENKKYIIEEEKERLDFILENKDGDLKEKLIKV